MAKLTVLGYSSLVMPPPISERINDKPADTPTYPWRHRFDRTNTKHLVGAFLIWTFFFSGVYAVLAYKDHEIKRKDADPAYAWWHAALDGLYYSIVTETTIGGDLPPQGSSRTAECIEVLGGLLIAGLFVTKFTTGPSGKTKALIERMSGGWIEFCKLSSGEIRTSLIHIRLQKGLLRYDGINFDSPDMEVGNPRYLGIFEGSSEPMSSINGPEIWFDYSNLEGDQTSFTSGRTSLHFYRLGDPRMEHPRFDTLPEAFTSIDEAREKRTRPYDYFEGFAEDKGKENLVPMFAYRLLESDQEKLAKTLSYSDKVQSDRSALVKAWLPRCKNAAATFEKIRKHYEERTARSART